MLNYIPAAVCSCGKAHPQIPCELAMGKGALEKLPQLLARLNIKNPFILSDRNTFEAAGEAVCRILRKNALGHVVYSYADPIEPDEKAVGTALMHFDPGCDGILCVGSGVINDIGKILSFTTGRSYIIVATAPSMDGYASASSSMIRHGLKITLPSKCPDAILGDTDILKNAPMDMLISGIGDMLAKYISIAEWRIGHLITGEYYCEEVAQLIRTALKRCVDNAPGLLSRDETAVEAVFEGLIIGGAAMAYAGVSRPASGIEHYFSHLWDMRSVAFGTPAASHGISCGVGTLYAARIYDQLRNLTPDREKALAYVKAFDWPAYQQTLRDYVGPGAKEMILLENRDGKYDPEKHKARLARILDNWQEIQNIIREEIPAASEIEALLDTLQAPKSCADFGIPEETLPMAFAATKDIRDKYVLSRLCFDLGILDEIKF